MSAQGDGVRRLGRYELITRIGQGGMAEVQLALQRGPAGFEKLVVVKLVHDSLATQKAFVDMLLDEARLAALVKHPNVVDIYDLGQADGRYFIAMEYLEGEPLLAVLRAGREGRRLDPLSTGRLIADTAEGLDAAHELRNMHGDAVELVHHDISLGNIVVLYTGQVKLVDFGVAKASQKSSGGTKVQGKFSYMAPEKLQGESGDRRSDIFSLGCVMWEALTLKRLFRGGNDSETMKQVLEMPISPPSTINGDVPVEYDEIVMRALDRDPAKRQFTAKELAVDLEELLRKHGYGAKNDRIAKYMQETFKAHIDARKKLVHEVASKGSASAEVVDAAFDEPALASGSPITPLPSTPPPLRAARTSGEFKPLPRFEPPIEPPIEPSIEPSIDIPKDAFSSDLDNATEISAPAFKFAEIELAAPPAPPAVIPEPAVATAASPEPAVERSPSEGEGDNGDATVTSPPIAPLDRLRVLLGTRKARLIAAAIGAGVVLVVLAIALGGSPPSKRAAAPAAADATPANVGTPAPQSDAAIAVAPIDAPAVAEIAPPPDAAEPPPSEPHHAVEPPHHPAIVESHHGLALRLPTGTGASAAAAPTAQELFQKAFQEFVRGDTNDALATLKTAKATNPSYPPIWRLLGQVYKKLGDRAQAKAAFTRYLALAPTASDAASIRKELEP
ncbi:MAG TPA: tetratricopeptide repeat protein [Kofleriaceae bacterium]